MKEQILKAGLKIWNKEGLDKITLRKIADELNITHPGILYYFDSVKKLKTAIACHAVEVDDKKVIRQLIVSEHEAVKHLVKSERDHYLIG